MAVYVDNMRAKHRGMLMFHMIADTTEELLLMADRIGVAHKWIQNPDTAKEHFDIPLPKRELAISFGAIVLTRRELGTKIRAKRAELLEA